MSKFVTHRQVKVIPLYLPGHYQSILHKYIQKYNNFLSKKCAKISFEFKEPLILQKIVKLTPFYDSL